MLGNGEQFRDYFYVEGVATSLLLAAMNKDAVGHIFSVGSGIGTEFKEMVHMVAEVVGTGEVVHVPWPQDYLHVETGDYVSDISKISTMLDWHPSVGLREGIEKTFSYYQRYGAHYFPICA